MKVETTWRGLALTGTYERGAGSRECPPSESTSIERIEVEALEPEAFEGAPLGILEYLERDGARAYPTAIDWVERKYQDEIHAALVAAGREDEEAADERGGCDDE